MFTIDASVHINALNITEPGSAESQAFLQLVVQQALLIVSPTLLLVEVAAAIGRIFNDASRGIAFAQAIQELPHQEFISLDSALADEALRLAAQFRLRGADAVYAAVAQRHNTILVTCDGQQIERLSPALKVLKPLDVVALFNS